MRVATKLISLLVLPSISLSLARYLYQPGASSAGGRFVAARTRETASSRDLILSIWSVSWLDNMCARSSNAAPRQSRARLRHSAGEVLDGNGSSIHNDVVL